MKRASFLLAAVLILVGFHLVYAGGRPQGLSGDDRPSLGGGTHQPGVNKPPTPSPPTATPPPVKPGPSLPPIPNNPYTGPQDPRTVQQGKLLENYSRDIKKLDGQYKDLQSQLFKTPVSSSRYQDIQKQMDAINKQKAAISDKFNKGWGQTLGSQAPPAPTAPSSAKTPAVTSSPTSSTLTGSHAPSTTKAPGHTHDPGAPWKDPWTTQWWQRRKDALDAIDAKESQIRKNSSLSPNERESLRQQIVRERFDTIDRFGAEFRNHFTNSPVPLPPTRQTPLPLPVAATSKQGGSFIDNSPNLKKANEIAGWILTAPGQWLFGEPFPHDKGTIKVDSAIDRILRQEGLSARLVDTVFEFGKWVSAFFSKPFN